MAKYYAAAMATALVLGAGLAKSDGDVIETFRGPHAVCVQVARVRAMAEGKPFTVRPGPDGTTIRVQTGDPRGDVVIFCGRNWKGEARWER